MGGLEGVTVATTRDAPSELDHLLAEQGAAVIHVPLIEIVDDDALAPVLADLGRYDWLVVTSQHGASRVGPAARAHPGLKLAAVGTATATTLARSAGRRVDIVPAVQRAAALIETLGLAVANTTVLVAQADIAPPELVEGLRSNGATVDSVIAYSTRPRTPTPNERQRLLGADAVTFASGSAVRAWVSAIGVEAPAVVVAIGPSTAATAYDLGLAVSRVAPEHSVPGLVAAVLDEFRP